MVSLLCRHFRASYDFIEEKRKHEVIWLFFQLIIKQIQAKDVGYCWRRRPTWMLTQLMIVRWPSWNRPCNRESDAVANLTDPVRFSKSAPEESITPSESATPQWPFARSQRWPLVFLHCMLKNGLDLGADNIAFPALEEDKLLSASELPTVIRGSRVSSEVLVIKVRITFRSFLPSNIVINATDFVRGCHHLSLHISNYRTEKGLLPRILNNSEFVFIVKCPVESLPYLHSWFRTCKAPCHPRKTCNTATALKR